MKRPALALTVLLSACATDSAPPVRSAAMQVPYAATGLERAIGQTAAGLTALFGQPDADIREGQIARKLQFTGPICVLDAYLYPKRAGEEPLVTYLDARETDGSPIDRASCVAALTRRDRAR